MSVRTPGRSPAGGPSRWLHLGLLGLYRRLPRRARIAVVRLLGPSYTVGAMCIVEGDGSALLLVRHAYRDRWGVPGGLLGRGESAQAAARREVREEVGVVVELLGEPAVVVDPGPRRVDLVFRARLAPSVDAADAEPRSPEIVEVGWFPPEALPPLQAETAGALAALARAHAQPLPPSWPGR
ncbi:MAG: NUDIX domain-containing protein [Acidimicrobiales bacterium]|nr:NUDIX domain-containing protein [Acidimicrobiales bacterium]